MPNPTRKLWIPLALLIGLLGLLSANPVLWAYEEDEGFVVTDKDAHQSKDYPSVPLANPVTMNIDYPTLEECRDELTLYAATIPLAIDLSNPLLAKVNVTLDWQLEDTDYDLFVFNDEGDQLDRSTSGDPGEEVILTALSNGDYWICVFNWLGASDYTLTVSMVMLELYQRPPPPPTPTPGARATSTPLPATPIAQGANTEPTATAIAPETFRTPGPDGETSERNLMALADARQAPPSSGGMSGFQIALIGITILGSAVGVGLVTLRIRRDLR